MKQTRLCAAQFAVALVWLMMSLGCEEANSNSEDSWLAVDVTFNQLSCRAGLECSPDSFKKQFGSLQADDCVGSENARGQADFDGLKKSCGETVESWQETSHYVQLFRRCLADAESVPLRDLCPYVETDFAIIDMERLRGEEALRPLSDNCKEMDRAWGAWSVRISGNCSSDTADSDVASQAGENAKSNRLYTLFAGREKKDESEMYGIQVHPMGNIDNSEGNDFVIVSDYADCPATEDNNVGALYGISGVDGRVLWTYCRPGPNRNVGGSYATMKRIRDVDGDGVQDLFVVHTMDQHSTACPTFLPTQDSRLVLSVLSARSGAEIYAACPTFHEEKSQFKTHDLPGAVLLAERADLNADGIPDPVAEPRYGESGFVAYSGKDGSVLWSNTRTWVGGIKGSVYPWDDVNSDGWPDLAVTDVGCRTDPKSKIGTAIFSGKDGSELQCYNVRLGRPTHDKDYNGDGIPDFLYTRGAKVVDSPCPSEPYGSPTIISGKDGKTLASACDRIPNYAGGLMADVTGDGNEEILLANIVYVLPTLDKLWEYVPPDGENLIGWDFSEVIQDLNGDGRNEVIAIATSPSGQAGNAMILSGTNGSILYSLGDVTDFPFGFALEKMVWLGDVSGKGKFAFLVPFSISGQDGLAVFALPSRSSAAWRPGARPVESGNGRADAPPISTPRHGKLTIRKTGEERGIFRKPMRRKPL